MLAGVRFLWMKLMPGQPTDEADNSNGAQADNTDISVHSFSVTVETEEGDIPEDVSDQQLLIEDSVLTSRAVMASGGLPPPPPPPPPGPFGFTKTPPPTTPPPSPSRSSHPSSPQLGTADKAVQSTGTLQSSNLPVRQAEFARTVHTFFNQHQIHSDNSVIRENTINGSVQTATAALVHVEDPEVIVRSLAVPLALAAPCRSKPPRCPPSSSYDRREIIPPNGQIGRDANSLNHRCVASAGGDASASSSAAPIASAGSSSPCFGLDDFADGVRRNSSLIDERCPGDNCMESCVYYSVRCCECIVL